MEAVPAVCEERSFQAPLSRPVRAKAIRILSNRNLSPLNESAEVVAYGGEHGIKSRRRWNGRCASEQTLRPRRLRCYESPRSAR